MSGKDFAQYSDNKYQSTTFPCEVRPIKPVLHHVLWLWDCVYDGMCPKPVWLSLRGVPLTNHTLHLLTVAHQTNTFVFGLWKWEGWVRQCGNWVNVTIPHSAARHGPGGTRWDRPARPEFSLFSWSALKSLHWAQQVFQQLHGDKSDRDNFYLSIRP